MIRRVALLLVVGLLLVVYALLLAVASVAVGVYRLVYAAVARTARSPRVVILVLAAALLASTMAAGTASAHEDGVFVGGGWRNGCQAVDAANRLHNGRPYQIVLENAAGNDIEWFMHQWDDGGCRPNNIAINIGLPWGASLHDAAQGAYFGDYIQQALTAKAHGWTHPYVIAMPEISCCGQAGEDIKAGRATIADYGKTFNLMRYAWKMVLRDSVVIFDVLEGPRDINPEMLLNSIDVVDGIGMNFYMCCDDMPSLAAFEARYVYAPYTLHWANVMAYIRHVAVYVPEWGIAYIDQPNTLAFALWTFRHRTEWAVSFNDDLPSIPTNLMGWYLPISRAVYGFLTR